MKLVLNSMQALRRTVIRSLWLHEEGSAEKAAAAFQGCDDHFASDSVLANLHGCTSLPCD